MVVRISGQNGCAARIERGTIVFRGGQLRLEFGLFDERIECQGSFASSMPVPSASVVRGFQSWLKKPRFLVVHKKSAVNLRDF